jgi:putative two-component system hydrogenase maturation factor HypX/HoxX
VGWLDFDFHNGAMSERQCLRLRDALRWVRSRATQVLVLAGGRSSFPTASTCTTSRRRSASTATARPTPRGAPSTPSTTWRWKSSRSPTASPSPRCRAMPGRAAALALAADEVWAHEGVVLNPHYKNMGNLYGSEYWTYSLPRRIGEAASRAVMQQRLPLVAPLAVQRGLLDACFAVGAAAFVAQARERAGPGRRV